MTQRPFLSHQTSSFPTSGVTTPSIVLPPELVELKGHTPSLAPPADLSSLDLSLPLSTLLKSGTKLAHTNAEHSAGAIALATGTLDLSEYVRYLTILWSVYRVMEDELDAHFNAGGASRYANATIKNGAYEALEALWKDGKGKGKMLRRSYGLAQDITFYLAYLNITETEDNKTNLIAPFPTPPFVAEILTNPPEDLRNFTSHLSGLSRSDPGLLLAHTYVRYLGDLSGGQLVASKIRRVYSLPPPPAGGTAFYEFDLDESGAGGVSLVKSKDGQGETLFERKKKVEGIKNWFRDCMDGNVGDDEALKARLVQEAITSFHLSTKIFSLLNPPSSPASAAPNTAAASTTTAHQRKPHSEHAEYAHSAATQDKEGKLGAKLTKIQEREIKKVHGLDWRARGLIAVAMLLAIRIFLGLIGWRGEDMFGVFLKKLIG